MDDAKEFPEQTQALVKADPAGRLLAKLDQATRMLAEAKTLDEVAQIVNLTEAVKTLAQAAKLGLEAHNNAAELNLKAQRRAGEMLAKLDKGQGGRPSKTADKATGVSDYRRTIDEAQVSATTAQRWQKVAAVPARRFEEYIEHEKKYCEELSTAALLRDAKKRAGEAAPAKSCDEYDGRAPVNQAIAALEQAIEQYLKFWPTDLLKYYPDKKLLEIAQSLQQRRAALTEADEAPAAKPAKEGARVELAADDPVKKRSDELGYTVMGARLRGHGIRYQVRRPTCSGYEEVFGYEDQLLEAWRDRSPAPVLQITCDVGVGAAPQVTTIEPAPLTTMPIQQSLDLPDDGGDYEPEPDTVPALA